MTNINSVCAKSVRSNLVKKHQQASLILSKTKVISIRIQGSDRFFCSAVPHCSIMILLDFSYFVYILFKIPEIYLLTQFIGKHNTVVELNYH